MSLYDNTTKICQECFNELPIEKFYKNKVYKDGYSYKCKKCSREYQTNNYINLYKRASSKSRKRNTSNLLKKLDSKAIAIYKAKKKPISLKNSINRKMLGRMRASLKTSKGVCRWEYLVDYTLDDLKKHLKKTMPKGYTWQDYIDGKLHIDHIIPIAVHNFTRFEHIDFKRAWALSNLQLLPARENLLKSDKITKPFQASLAI